jgi:L-alanine-DL-glutamate epimerase-like enolase superfamily enzyme
VTGSRVARERAPATTPLRVVDVRVEVLSDAPTEVIEMSFGRLARRALALMEVESADGLVGYGESWVNHPAWAGAERLATIREGVAPLLVGEDARGVAALHEKMVRALEPVARQWGAPGPIMQAISGADIALWDLHAKSLGLAIGELAGGPVRDRVQVYASGLGPDDVAGTARRCRDLGFRAIKLRVGFGWEVDRRNVREAREAVGPDVAIMVDVNQAWTLQEALDFAGVLRECDVAWVEEPIAGNGLAELEEYARRTGLRVATGENLYGRRGFMPYAASRHVDVLQPDVSKTGGFGEALAVGNDAAALGKTVTPHLYGGAVAYAATLQLAACCSAVGCIELDVRSNPLRDPLIVDPPAVEGGSVAIPQAPGLGITLNEAALADLRRRAA